MTTLAKAAKAMNAGACASPHTVICLLKALVQNRAPSSHEMYPRLFTWPGILREYPVDDALQDTQGNLVRSKRRLGYSLKKATGLWYVSPT